MKVRITTRKPRILDFDLETVAAGFADPNWVPQKVTCVAWSWLDEDKVHVHVCGQAGLYSSPSRRARMLEKMVAQIDKADMVTGHNLLRFDLPVLQSDCLRLGLPPLGPVLVHDTMRIVRTKGFKKGQDVIGSLLRTREQKLPLNWQQWEDAYEDIKWTVVKERCSSDVLQHKEMYTMMVENGWLHPPRVWKP